MNKWERTSLDEQETIIHLDYKEKKMNVWTNRKIVGNKLLKVLPSKPSIIGGKEVYALEWTIPFNKRGEIRSCFSINRILSNCYDKNKKNQCSKTPKQ